MAVKAKISVPSTPPRTPLTGEAAAQAEATAKEHTLFTTKFQTDLKAANKAALASKATFAGFDVASVAAFMGINPSSALSLMNQANAGGVPEKALPFFQHMAEHPFGSHYSGDFNIGTSAVRGLEAFGSGGISELARKKPFQPGGSQGSFLQAVPGVGQVAGGLQGAKTLTRGAAPPAPATPPPTPNQAAARAALDKADVERRKQLATSTGMTSVLGLPGEASVKRTVLG